MIQGFFLIQQSSPDNTRNVKGSVLPQNDRVTKAIPLYHRSDFLRW